jgi:hypothetical protein
MNCRNFGPALNLNGSVTNLQMLRILCGAYHIPICLNLHRGVFWASRGAKESFALLQTSVLNEPGLCIKLGFRM